MKPLGYLNGLCLLAIISTPITLKAGQYFQDFHAASEGATNFNDGSQLFSTALGSVAKVTGGAHTELQLTESAHNTRTAFLLPELDPATPIYAFSAKWNSQVYGSFPNAGDGFSFNFGQLGTTNLLTSTSQESGYGVGLAFCVQTSTNNNPGFYIRVNGSTAASIPNNPQTVWQAGNITRHFFEVDWNYTNGLSVRMDGQPIFTNVATTNFTPTVGDRFVWAARTGSASEEVRLDNIVVLTGGNLVSVPTTSAFADTATEPAQPADNAFDGNLATSWVTSTNKGFISAGVSPTTKVVAYTLTSGSLGTSADPQNWTLEGSNDGGTTWHNASNGRGIFLIGNETRAHLATNFVSYSRYRLNISTNYGATSTSLSEVRFYGMNRVAPVNIFASLSPTENAIRGVAISTDGHRLSAVAGGNFAMHSTDYGVTWFNSYSGLGGSVHSIASSADGRKLVAAGESSGRIFVGTEDCNDGCFSWTQSDAPAANWFAVACSSNGVRMAATAWGDQGAIYMSTNSGVNWTSTGPTNWWLGLAMSANGTKMYASALSGAIYRSIDSGVTWALSSPNFGQVALACSADGTKVVSARGVRIYLSSDSGASWHVSGAPTNDWYCAAMSADGTKLVAGAVVSQYGEGVYASTDSGATWRKIPNLPSLDSWETASMSSDGSTWAVGSPYVNQLAIRHPLLLRTKQAGPNVAVFWSASQTGLGLEMNSDLSTPNWVTATNAVSTEGRDYKMLFPASGQKFFRLTP